LDCWIAGLLDCWIVGLLDCWIVGLLDSWTVGLLDCWIVGLLDCWIIGLLKVESCNRSLKETFVNVREFENCKVLEYMGDYVSSPFEGG
jgi:hypothetical protein